MRDDMDKVIVDRTRRGGGRVRKGRAVKDMDELPSRVGRRSSDAGKPYGWEGKEFNDHLQPLKRYMMKQVGRPWDKVWSEICAGKVGNDVTIRHLREHVFNYVQLKPEGSWWAHTLGQNGWWKMLYVEGGIVKKNKKYRM